MSAGGRGVRGATRGRRTVKHRLGAWFGSGPRRHGEPLRGPHGQLSRAVLRPRLRRPGGAGGAHARRCIPAGAAPPSSSPCSGSSGSRGSTARSTTRCTAARTVAAGPTSSRRWPCWPSSPSSPDTPEPSTARRSRITYAVAARAAVVAVVRGESPRPAREPRRIDAVPPRARWSPSSVMVATAWLPDTVRLCVWAAVVVGWVVFGIVLFVGRGARCRSSGPPSRSWSGWRCSSSSCSGRPSSGWSTASPRPTATRSPSPPASWACASASASSGTTSTWSVPASPRAERSAVTVWFFGHLPQTGAIAVAGAAMVGLVEEAHSSRTPTAVAWTLSGAVAVSLLLIAAQSAAVVQREGLDSGRRAQIYAVGAVLVLAARRPRSRAVADGRAGRGWCSAPRGCRPSSLPMRPELTLPTRALRPRGRARPGVRRVRRWRRSARRSRRPPSSGSRAPAGCRSAAPAPRTAACPRPGR